VRQRGQQPERERETGIEAGIPGFQGNKKQPNSDRWNAAATTTTKTGLETKKKKLALLPFYNVLWLLHREKCEKYKCNHKKYVSKNMKC